MVCFSFDLQDKKTEDIYNVGTNDIADMSS